LLPEEIGWTEVTVSGETLVLPDLGVLLWEVENLISVAEMTIFFLLLLHIEIIQWVVDRDMFSGLVSF
jgi:hypothetical protein